MTKILILGGGGMIGQKLARRIVDHDIFPAADVTLFDRAFPPAGVPAKTVVGDISDPATARMLAAERPDVVFHLAAVVSGQAETEFELGWNVNMMAIWHLLSALRSEHLASGSSYRPRLVFTSSIAVFGGPYPDKIGDDFLSAPQTSYGAQKAACEMMVGDFSRKGFIDGLSLRLPTICVRPGKANAAASSFFSGIIREPLNGVEAVLPVADTVRNVHASPRAAARFLTHAAKLDTDLLEGRRALNLPGFSCTVAEQIEALRRVAGQDVVDLVKHVPDPAIMAIVNTWPQDFAPDRALSLGFEAESSFDEIIRVYIEDDLTG
ncbi:NAD-dependent epimerase/dehydratase [Sulfitobacter noctilucicola]|uniref:Nucleoside-diphosphate-sugar epimerase n=1 Tax=Sulfitobacter noctilucicola TaxID=1342301 RepID=A0A7W6Q7T1_9RHOB|nr:D-erythronate dehydrogenase [Sulfitobacter noctilucicola]KIN70181.1 NAD-dependent epimerase/dehydratase [Sulfitobacter noctilucicola]MBB4176182.1 nucleoside-diphosphate-sugar epimerase [Sulfitobacter noctilucicola]